MQTNRLGRGLKGSRRWAAASLMIAVFCAPQLVRAQTADVAASPPNIVVPNYEGIPAGPFGGLEGSAYAARANDPSAAWFNPAGLSRAKGAQITGSAGLYQLTSVSPEAIPGTGSSVQNLPNLVGLTVQAGDKLTLGMAILTPVSWVQTTNAQLLTTTNGNQERFAYSANSAFSRRVAAFSAGYDSGGKWRAGGGLTFMDTNLTSGQTISDRIAAPTDLRTLLVSSNLSGSELQIGFVGGVQIDPSPHVRIGAVMRTPGFSVHQSGTAALDGTAHTGAASLGASFLDTSAEFHYNMPFEATGAIAFVGTRAELEVDVHGYSSVSPYALMSSPTNDVIYRDAGNGAPPTVVQQPFPGLTSASRALANASVGGHVQLRANRELRLHYGIASDFSPVASEDQVFDQVDLFTWTLGLSGRAGKLSYAAGINYRGGTSHTIVLRNLFSGDPAQTSIKISTIGMIYSVSYQF